jgi:hypothetical protein
MMRYHSRKGATLERLQTGAALFASPNGLLFGKCELYRLGRSMMPVI